MSRIAMEYLVDVIGMANDLRGIVETTDADEEISDRSGILLDVAGKLQSVDAVPDANPTEGFASLLGLKAMLQSPECFQIAAQRLYDRLSELLQVDAGAGDREVINALECPKETAPDSRAPTAPASITADAATMPFAELVHSVDRLSSLMERSTGTVDLYNCAVGLGAATDRWIPDECRTIDPERNEAGRVMRELGGQAWELVSQLVELDVLAAHPELLTLLVERMRTSISAVLQGLPDPYKGA